ncbi:helix-turn-helix transcriptional regulator [bacterium]|nr:helix-turn-helix transcriptional regulator [bacterium]
MTQAESRCTRDAATGAAETDAARATERIRPIDLQWPCLNLLGMGAWWAWIWLCYNSTQLFIPLPGDAQPVAVRIMYLASTAGIALMTLLGGLFWRRATALVRSNALVLAMAVGAGVATAFVAPLELHAGPVASVAAAVLTGMGTSALCLKSGYLYGQMGLGYTLTAGCIALSFAALLFFTGMALSGPIAVAYVACLPIVSAGLMCLREEDALDVSFTPDNASSPVREARAVYYRLVAASCGIALIAGVSRGISTSVMSTERFAQVGELIVACVGVIGVVIAGWVNGHGAKKALKGSYTALMLFAIVVALVSNFGTLITLLSISKEPLWMIMSCLLAYMAFRFDFSPVRTFGISQSSYFVSSLVGWGIGGVLGDLTTDALKLMVSIVLCIAILAIYLFVFRAADIDFIVDHKRGRGHRGSLAAVVGAGRDGALETGAATGAGAHARPDEGDAAGGRDAAGARPAGRGYTDDELMATFALSQREVEIARMFAQGRSANWIADELTISKNTVRSHLRAAYVKLDVHTRQELIDTLG